MKRFSELLLFIFTLALFIKCSDSIELNPEDIDNPPVITEFSSSANIVKPNDTLSLQIKFTDKDKSDTVFTVKWHSDLGTFFKKEGVDTTINTTHWIAPDKEGAVKISVIVSDQIRETEKHLTISVQKNPSAPPTPNLVSPLNNQQNVNIKTSLKWSVISTSIKFNYDIYLDTLANPKRIDTAITSTNYEVNLEYNKTYYWKIVAVKDDTTFTSSDVYQFTTKKNPAQGDPSKFDFVTVPAGEFTFGKGDTVKNLNYEFQITKYEITNKEYADFLNLVIQDSNYSVINGYLYGFFDGDNFTEPGKYKMFKINGSQIDYINNTFSVKEGFENYPVANVTWFGANQFALYYKCTLPDIYEWEKAARGNTGNDFPWGDEISLSYANYIDTSNTGIKAAVAVGSYTNGNTVEVNGKSVSTKDNSSSYGAYDMAGNIWEWTSTNFGGGRILRGGSFIMNKDALYSWKDYVYPVEAAMPYIGFRIVKK